MNYETVIVACFAVCVFGLCRLWNMLMMRQREKARIIKESKISIMYEESIADFGDLKLEGTGNDSNSDYEFIQAVRMIELPDEVRVKIYD